MFTASGRFSVPLLIILIEAVTANRLPSATRAGLQIAPQFVQCATKNAAIITLGVVEVIWALTIRQTLILP